MLLLVITVLLLTAGPLTAIDTSDVRYLGCYYNRNAVFSEVKSADNGLSIIKCITQCMAGGYAYAGLMKGNECSCGLYTDAYYEEGRATLCNTICAGNSNELCGSLQRMSVYKAECEGNTKFEEINLTGSYKSMCESVSTQTASNLADCFAKACKQTTHNIINFDGNNCEFVKCQDLQQLRLESAAGWKVYQRISGASDIIPQVLPVVISLVAAVLCSFH